MIGVMTRSRLVAWALCVVGLALVGIITFVDTEMPDGEFASSMFFALAVVASAWLIIGLVMGWVGDRLAAESEDAQ